MYEQHLDHTRLIDAIGQMEAIDELDNDTVRPELRLFACWQRLDDTFDCRILPMVTAALPADLGQPGRVDGPLIAALDASLPELCHPDGYYLAGIGLAADRADEPAFNAWVALVGGSALKYQRHSDGAEARIHLEPGDPLTIAETVELHLARLLLNRATGQQPAPYLDEPEPTEVDRLLTSLKPETAARGVISAHVPDPVGPTRDAVTLTERMTDQPRPHLADATDPEVSAPSIVRAVEMLLEIARRLKRFTTDRGHTIDQAEAQAVTEAADRVHALSWPLHMRRIFDSIIHRRTDTTPPATTAAQR